MTIENSVSNYFYLRSSIVVTFSIATNISGVAVLTILAFAGYRLGYGHVFLMLCHDEPSSTKVLFSSGGSRAGSGGSLDAHSPPPVIKHPMKMK